jgi:hypothetical protein
MKRREKKEGRRQGKGKGEEGKRGEEKATKED